MKRVSSRRPVERAGLVTRARELVPFLREGAIETERRRAVAPETLARFR
jgi:hypothetical protein